MHLFFDLDGTVVDHRRRMYTPYRDFCGARGYPAMSFPLYMRLKRQGTSERDLVLRTLPEQVVDEYLQWKRSCIESPPYLALDRLYPSAARTLATAAREHALVAVTARNAPERAETELEGLRIRRCFSKVLYCGGKTGEKARLLTGHVRISGISTESSFIVGDSEDDILAGQAAGIRSIAITHGVRSGSFLQNLKPDAVIKNLSELIPLLRTGLGNLRDRAE